MQTQIEKCNGHDFFKTMWSLISFRMYSILFLWFSSGFLFVLRPEPILMLMLTIVLGIIATSNEGNISSSIFWVILIAGTSVALHPAGLTTVFAGSPFVLCQLYKNFKKHFWTVMSAASFSLSIMFLNSSPKWFLLASNGYTQGVLPGSNEARYVENVDFYDEWLRVETVDKAKGFIDCLIQLAEI